MKMLLLCVGVGLKSRAHIFVIDTCVKNLKIGSDYKERRDVDQWLGVDPGHVSKCFIIDSGSALHHFVCPPLWRRPAQSGLSPRFPTARTIHLSTVHVHTVLSKPSLCIGA